MITFLMRSLVNGLSSYSINSYISLLVWYPCLFYATQDASYVMVHRLCPHFDPTIFFCDTIYKPLRAKFPVKPKIRKLRLNFLICKFVGRGTKDIHSARPQIVLILFYKNRLLKSDTKIATRDPQRRRVEVLP